MNELLTFLGVLIGWIVTGSVVLSILHALKFKDRVFMWFCIVWLHVYWFLVYVGVSKMFL